MVRRYDETDFRPFRKVLAYVRGCLENRSFDETAGLHTFEEGEEPALVYSQLKRTEAGREASVPKNIRFSLEGALFDSGRTVGQQH